MAKTTTISWCDHTFNPWIGCSKVSAGCTNCYAETIAEQYGLAVWGPAHTTPRKFVAESTWKGPARWDRAAAKAGERRRVFCGSMCDVFELHPQLTPHRRRLFDVIETTRHLDWLLLTKRPENIALLVPPAWLAAPRPNVWYGTSVENAAVTHRIDTLRELPAVCRFLSVEPLIGPVGSIDLTGIDWVIVGGESGPRFRPMEISWAEDVVRQARDQGVPVWLKQDRGRRAGQRGRIPDHLWVHDLPIVRGPVTMPSSTARAV